MPIISWNCNGIRTQFEEMSILLKETIPAVLCLQETKLTPDRRLEIKDYTTYRKDKEIGADERAHGGVATAVRKHIYSEEIERETPLQALIVSVRLSFTATICNLYLPPNEPINEPALLQLINSLPSPYILVGNLNGSHHSWRQGLTNTRGNAIRRIIDATDSLLLNTGEMTYLCPRKGTYSAIDLLLLQSRNPPDMERL